MLALVDRHHAFVDGEGLTAAAVLAGEVCKDIRGGTHLGLHDQRQCADPGIWQQCEVSTGEAVEQAGATWAPRGTPGLPDASLHEPGVPAGQRLGDDASGGGVGGEPH